MSDKPKLIIIGAGLSGVYSALLLQDSYDVIVLEARERIGGRILTLEGHDMGPSWIWKHQTHILDLIAKLGLEIFEQYTLGDALYDAPHGLQRFSPPSGVPSYRVKGGIFSIIDALEKKLQTPVHLNEKVISMEETNAGILLETQSNTYVVDKVISTLPPRLAAENIVYDPPLISEIKKQFKNTPTWMGYAGKCVIEYTDNFWRKEGLSGFCMSHLGPLGEIHDACTQEKAALFGFIHSRAPYVDIKEHITAQLVRLYGDKASTPLHIYVMDWKKEIYTSTHLDAQPLSAHPSYGFDVTHFDEKLIFSGTEGAKVEGGYLEGAVYKSELVCERLLRK